MNASERGDVVTVLTRLASELAAPDATLALLPELVDVARELGVPTGERRDDAPVFLSGTESIETATWAQCGGILFALERQEGSDPVFGAVAVARRLAVLAPTHR